MSPAPTPARATRGDGPRRRYDSPLRTKRTEETKAAIISASTELFVARGWGNTGMRDVARLAGVAVETLYSHYPSKRKLFDATIDQSVMGDDEPVAVAAGPEFLAMGKGRRADRIAAAASIATAINRRTIPFARLVREAAATDPEIAEVLAATRDRQRQDVRSGLMLVLGRPPTDDEVDSVWAITGPEVYLLFVEVSGWSPDQYERWLSQTLARVLPRS